MTIYVLWINVFFLHPKCDPIFFLQELHDAPVQELFRIDYTQLGGESISNGSRKILKIRGGLGYKTCTYKLYDRSFRVKKK